MGASIAGRTRGRRRMMSEINVVPYIDVTLVLLIIFMVTAPMIVTGTIDLPKVGKASQASVAAIEISILRDGQITVKQRTEGAKEKNVTRDQLVAEVRALGATDTTPVIISAERAVRYEHVMGAMDVLSRNGIGKVGLNVRME